MEQEQEQKIANILRFRQLRHPSPLTITDSVLMMKEVTVQWCNGLKFSI